jgi:hypothetical protein
VIGNGGGPGWQNAGRKEPKNMTNIIANNSKIRFLMVFIF